MAGFELRLKAQQYRSAFAAAMLVLVGRPAWAHLVSTGFGPVYDNIYHFLLSPEYDAPVLGMALLAGQRGPGHGRLALFAITGACFVGAILGIAPNRGIATSIVTASSCLVLGILVASDLPLPPAITAGLAGVVGFLTGAMNAAAPGNAGNIAGAIGVSGTVFVLSALTAALVVPLRVEWFRIAVRVAGSWLAALGLLLVGWAVRAG